MRVVVATADFEAVGFNVPVAEFIDRARSAARNGDLRGSGPTCSATTFDAPRRCARLRAAAAIAIADALLDQRVVAGIGNVYKSEVLFLCRRESVRAGAGEIADERLLNA